MTLGMVLLHGPRRRVFLMSEVPLWRVCVFLSASFITSYFFSLFLLSSLELSDAKVYEP